MGMGREEKNGKDRREMDARSGHEDFEIFSKEGVTEGKVGDKGGKKGMRFRETIRGRKVSLRGNVGKK